MRFQTFIRAAQAAGRLVVQPRMGMPRIPDMRRGLAAVRAADALTVGTITLDSYTRVGDHASAAKALASGHDLNGYPIVAHPIAATREMLDGIQGGNFPIQVRHGSALPYDIFVALAEAGCDATEGGPVSYCLPYSRTPLARSVEAWTRCCEVIARESERGNAIHLESFGGCMLGQLCPPSLLVAISVLEGIFFARHGVRSVSLSYAQQTSTSQDLAALAAMRRLAAKHLAHVDHHIVLYTYMGVFPRTRGGAEDLLAESVRLAVHGGAARLIVKTPAEAHRIPTVEENVAALEFADGIARRERGRAAPEGDCAEAAYQEAAALVEAVLDLHEDPGLALAEAFRRGVLDVPYCLHADNAGRTRALVDRDGRLRWQNVGGMPIRIEGAQARGARIGANDFLHMLSSVERRFDAPHLAPPEAASPIADESRPAMSTNLAHLSPRADRTIAIVGTGPRGIATLERLALRLAETPPSGPVRIVAIDDIEVGAGRIWRTDQADWFLMNTVAGQVTMYSGPADEGPARAGAGPTLAEWLAHQNDPDLAALGPNDYAPRVAYGMYLRDVFDAVVAGLPPMARVERVRGRVTSIARESEGLALGLADGRVLRRIDRVLLATGHPRNRPTGHEARIAEFAERHRHLTFIPGDSAADMPLDAIAPGSTVGIIGAGLGFYDVLFSLTLGRGGRFRREGGRLRYQASGREPSIVAISRSGVPILARGVNQKRPNHSYEPTFFTRAAVEAARARALAQRGSAMLDFDTELRPLIQREVEHVYYGTHIRRRYGEEAARDFAREHAALAAPTPDALGALLASHGVADVPAIDLERLARPFADRSFASAEEWSAALLAFLRDDIAEAKLGNVEGPLKAALDVIRDVRDIIRQAVEHGGLTPASHRDGFLTGYGPIIGLLTAGPPLVRIEQTIALMEAGVLGFAGPNASCDCDEDARAFTISSPQVAGSLRIAQTLVDSRIPRPDVKADLSTLTRDLLAQGAAREHVREEGGTVFATGGLDVTKAPFALVDAEGRPDPDVFALGIPTEHTRWFTQVGSGTPGVFSRFHRDADAVAEALLAERATVEADGSDAAVGAGERRVA